MTGSVFGLSEPHPPTSAPHERVVEIDAIPRGPYRLPGAGRDGVMRRRGRGLARVIHHGDECAVVHAWATSRAVRLRAVAPSDEAAAYAIERMRFALCLDYDPRPFYERFRSDRLLGPILRRKPWLRPKRLADPFQALAWAVTEQLIEQERAWEIQRRLAWRYGRRSECGTFVDAPSARALAGRAQSELEACDLSAGRSRALIHAAREVANGWTDLSDLDSAWQRLIRIPAIGRWTLEKLAYHGLGRLDLIPAADLAFLKMVGRLAGLGRRATEDEVREFFEPYAPYSALAAFVLVTGQSRYTGAKPPATVRGGYPATRPWRAGARW